MINLLNSFKEKYPSVTYADMYQLASALAIEVGALGLTWLALPIWDSLRACWAILIPDKAGCSSLLTAQTAECFSRGLAPAAARSGGGSTRHVSQNVWSQTCVLAGSCVVLEVCCVASMLPA